MQPLGKLQYESHLQTCDKVAMHTTFLVSPFVRISNYYSEFYTRDQDIYLEQFTKKPTFFLPDHNSSDSLGSIYSDTQV